MHQRPVLIVNPRGDQAFADFVQETVEAGSGTPDALQAILRQRYPLAVVHRRELSSEPVVVWYVYRDGHWIRPSGVGRG